MLGRAPLLLGLSRILGILGILGILALPAPTTAGRFDVPLVVLLRALAYDEALPQRAGSEVSIGVLHRADDPDSKGEADGVIAALDKLARLKIQGLPIRARAIAFSDVETLRAQATEQSLDVLYLCSGLEASVGAIVGVARGARLVSMSAHEPYVPGGVALTAVPHAATGRARLIVRIEAAWQEGLRLAPELLRVVERVE